MTESGRPYCEVGALGMATAYREQRLTSLGILQRLGKPGIEIYQVLRSGVPIHICSLTVL